ncbi:MAG: 4Fe-4S binding protein [Phycisphaerae bacterium]|nr:4Fe-4S binding protein [Phycisphaerae bacterium]
MDEQKDKLHRRQFLRSSLRNTALIAAGIAIGKYAGQSNATVWQIDPAKCTACGKCATACVKKISAVKCLHAYAMCGYCDLCTGFLNSQPNERSTAAENQLCPTAAIVRTFIEDPYYEYKIIEELCIGCGKCVKGCGEFGNGSLYLQIKRELCEDCNECALAVQCPAQAISRVPADKPYLHNG